ncbi:MAG TPA: DUF5597 domain-containing protein [Lacunisphaera sp.]|nr:DUF5597 domain-containing protein [Lacunisphaera sp.]
MKTRLFLLTAAALALAAPLPAATEPQPPHLEKRGVATQLIVDGQPWLVRGGELANTASSDLAYMESVWPKLTQLNLNTVLVAVAWAWVEPEENKFDFTLVDRLLDGARRNHQHIVFLWFGSWKNSVSSFAPAWVKADTERFPRVRLKSDRAVEILSPLGANSLQADTRAYVRFLQHLAEVDPQHTVLMIQLQNEVGVLGDSRDRGAAANTAFAAAVPPELMRWLAAHRETLSRALARQWAAAGGKSAGTWEEVFGAGPATDEIFMAWQYANYMGRMAAAGKAAYPLPVFTNTWIVQPEDKGPGDYPSGGPQPLTLDVWKAGAPAIDLNAPDIYLPDFNAHTAAFHRPDNPLFVPESRGDAAGVANAFQCIGDHASIGYSPFGIDHAARLTALRPAPGTPPPADLAATPLARAYAVLRDLTPLILEHQAKGTIAAAWLNKDKPKQEIELGDYTLDFAIRRNRRTGEDAAPLGYALVFALGRDEYLLAGTDVQVTFRPHTAGPAIAGIADAEAGVMTDGRWVPHRKMSGDDILLNHDLNQAAAANQSGSGLLFGPDGPTLQRVKLYRYQ